MISVDSSSFIAYFKGDKGHDVDRIEEALTCNSIILPPVVLSELLSDPAIPKELVETLSSLPLLEPKEGYWQRVGFTRCKLIAKKVKARLADCLIAQICIDYDIYLITRDNDFRHFQKYCGLKIFN